MECWTTAEFKFIWMLIRKLNVTSWKDSASTAMKRCVSVTKRLYCPGQVRSKPAVPVQQYLRVEFLLLGTCQRSRISLELSVKVDPMGQLLPLLLLTGLLFLLPPARVLKAAAKWAFAYPTSRLSCVLGRSISIFLLRRSCFVDCLSSYQGLALARDS